MSIKAGPATRSPYTDGTEGAYDAELVVLTSTDYVPRDAAGNVVTCRGFIICTATGAVKLDTAGGTTITIPSGLAVGIEHAIKFTKIYSGTTTATGLVALT